MRKHLVSLLAVGAAMACSAAAAATIDFTGYPDGGLGSNVLATPNGTFTGYGSQLYNLSSSYFSGSGGAICPLASGSFTCEADLQLVFAGPVSNLSFQTVGYDSGDSVLISAYNAADVLLGQISVTADQVVDFSAYSNISKLYFDDSSTGAGYGYGQFNFNVSAVPEPETAALMLAGLGVIGFVGKRRRAR